MADDRKRPRARLRRRHLLLVAVLAPILLAGAAYMLLRMQPVHYRDHVTFLERTTPEQRELMVEAVRQRMIKLSRGSSSSRTHAAAEQAAAGVLDQLLGNGAGDQPLTSGTSSSTGPARKHASKPRDVVATLELSRDELRALVAEQFEDWLADQRYDVPGEVRDPTVTDAEGKWVVAFAVEAGSMREVLSAFYDVRFRPDGRAEARLQRLAAGQLPLPASGAGLRLAQRLGSPDRSSEFDRWLTRLQRVVFEPVLRVDDIYMTVQQIDIRDSGYVMRVRLQDPETYERLRPALSNAAS